MKSETIRRNNKKQNPHSMVWFTAFVLSILVIATVSVVGMCLYNYANRSDCEISLYEGHATDTIQAVKSAASQTTADPVMQSQSAQYSGDEAKKQSAQNSFSVKDAEQVWKTETTIKLFSAEYTNKNGAVTVKSADSGHVIAPGTEGSYTFSLKNTGDTTADYKVWVEADISSNITGVPLETRMSGQSGWMLGGKHTWKSVDELDGVSAKETIDAGKSAEYTIYWQWPFEKGDDAADTRLGNASASAEQEMTYTVTIYTMTATSTATAKDKGQSGNRIKAISNAVKTGDTAQLMLWIFLAAASLTVVIVLLVMKKRKNDKEHEDTENGQQKNK